MSKKDFLILCLFLALMVCVAALRFQHNRYQKLVDVERTENIVSTDDTSSGDVKTDVTASDNSIHIHKGYECFQREDFECLIEESAAAIEIDPDDAMAYNNRAYGYLRLNKLNLAEKDIDKALRLDSNHTLALNNRGLLLIKKGKFASALEFVEKAEKNDESIPEIYLNKGLIFAGKKEYKKALEEFNKAIRINPELAIVYEERSHIFKLLDEFDKAEADKLKAKEIREYR